MKDFFNRDRKDQMYYELDYINDLVAADILVFDDVGTEKQSEWVREKYYQIFEMRHLKPKNKINLWTANEGPNELQHKLGDKIMSRMFASAEVIEMAGEDWRQK